MQKSKTHKKMKQIRIIVNLLLILTPSLTFSQKYISVSEKNNVIENIKELIDSNYVFIDKVEYINSSLDSLNLTGKYRNIKDYEIFANVLTDDLVEITKDLHFKVQYNPEFIKSNRQRRQTEGENQKEPEKEEYNQIDWNLWYAKKENYGFEKIEILGGNIGYIKLNFWQPVDWAKPTIDATMAFVANTDALIIDLTENQGGYSPTDRYLGSYFFDEEPLLWTSSYNRPTGQMETMYTFKKIGGKRYLDKPIFILISKNTFSLAEQFAYCMKHFGKATIVGQTSSGAAHAIHFPEVNDNFSLQLPISRSIHPITQKDWEGTGVIPDINTSDGDALRIAHLYALDIIISSLEKQKIVGPILKRYYKIKTEISER